MSHTPPIPGSAQSPYPLSSEQATSRDEARRALAERPAPDPAPEIGTGARWPRYAAGAAIGSAAVAAALLYYNRSKAD